MAKRSESDRRIRDNGYVMVRREGHVLADRRGWVPEHRLVAYDAGLLTDLSDSVHHRDGNKQNNLLENLDVMSKAEHALHHAYEPGSIQAAKRAKTHCLRGHLFDDENTYIHPARGTRHCIACSNLLRRQRRDVHAA